MTEQQPVAVLGGGSFGTAIDNLLAANGQRMLKGQGISLSLFSWATGSTPFMKYAYNACISLSLTRA